METFRAFIAVDLPLSVAQALAAVIAELQPRVPEKAVRWMEPERIHLTLRFLGDTPVQQIDGIGRLLDEVAAGFEPFTLHLDNLGCFPNPRRPRVIWVGFEGQQERLQALKKAVDNCLQPLGWAPETQPFHPHLTLGRVKRHQDKIRLSWGKPVVREEVPITALHLFESQLRPQGPLYTIRHSSRLAA